MPYSQTLKHNIILLFLSFSIHIFGLISFQIFSKPIPSYSNQDLFMVEPIAQDQLQKLKKVGIKNGKKEFSSPLSLSQLSQATLTQAPKAKSKAAFTTKKRVFIPHSVKNIARQLPGRVDFDLQFSPPEGVPEDELNSVEKIFFGFYKRSYETFVSAVYRTISEQIAMKPFLKKYLTGTVRTLNATVTFDKKGRILNISKVTGTTDFELLKLYRLILLNMNSIPNPPVLFTKQNSEFKMYYKLKLGLK